MAISFPTSLDNFSNPASTDSLNTPSHSLQHTDLNDAVEAMQRKVGVGTAVAGSASAGQVLTISAAGTSTWSTPSSGLVQVVPTSVAVGSGSGSVSASGAVTFTGASSVSINNCFSATYDNYKIHITLSSTTDTDLQIRLRASGSDNSTASSYNNQRLLATSTTVSGVRQTDSYFRSINVRDNDYNALDFTFFRPFLTKPTLMNGLVNYGENNGSGLQFFIGGHNQSVSYDGFTFFGPTVTGTVRIYGLSN